MPGQMREVLIILEECRTFYGVARFISSLDDQTRYPY